VLHQVGVSFDREHSLDVDGVDDHGLHLTVKHLSFDEFTKHTYGYTDFGILVDEDFEVGTLLV